MRTNTKSILLSLWGTDEPGVPALSQETVSMLTDMTKSGYRSLIHYLEQQDLIRVSRISTPELQITRAGTQQLEADFPALSSKWDEWQGGWSCIIFLEPPKGDRQFRRLRKLLLSEHALAVSRGVYLFAGSLSLQLQYELEAFYKKSVAITTIGDWGFGKDPILYSVKTIGNDLFSVYSGTSKHLYRLLALKGDKKGLINKVNKTIYSDFALFRENIGSDPGYFKHYFPGKIGGAEALKLFQDVLRAF